MTLILMLLLGDLLWHHAEAPHKVVAGDVDPALTTNTGVPGLGQLQSLYQHVVLRPDLHALVDDAQQIGAATKLWSFFYIIFHYSMLLLLIVHRDDRSLTPVDRLKTRKPFKNGKTNGSHEESNSKA